MDFFNLITVEDAKRIYEHCFQGAFIAEENIPLLDSLHRILAEDVVSDVDIPTFNRSVMDGYALRAEDTFGASPILPAYLSIVGEVIMGQATDAQIKKGQSIKIATGGMLPVGANAVMMIEHTEQIAPDQIEVKKGIAVGENVVHAGDDLKRGEVLLSKGRRIEAQDIAALAAIGKLVVKVYGSVRVGIISSGDELVSPQDSPQPGQVRDINSYLLSSKIKEMGGQPFFFGLVKDNPQLIQAAVLELIRFNEIVLISGGSSIGSRDLVVEALKEAKAEILVHGVAIRPGKPTLIAKLQGKPVFGLPGHPASAMIAFIVLVKPLIEKLQGTQPVERHLKAITTRNIHSLPGREDYIRVSLEWTNGRYLASPIFGNSGLISPLVKSDGLLRIPMDSEGIDQAEEVEVIAI